MHCGAAPAVAQAVKPPHRGLLLVVWTVVVGVVMGEGVVVEVGQVEVVVAAVAAQWGST